MEKIIKIYLVLICTIALLSVFVLADFDGHGDMDAHEQAPELVVYELEKSKNTADELCYIPFESSFSEE